jgi:uncharacterized coiled-coil protein SlyX
LDNERHARLVVEEQLQATSNRMRAMEAKLNESQKKLQNIENIVNQGRANASDLQAQLDAVTQEKNRLESQLQGQPNQPKPAEGK